MMKKVVLTLCSLFVAGHILAINSFAMDTRLTTLEKTPFNKLIRGIVNSLTFIVELPASISDVSKRKGTLAGCTLGVGDGIATSFLRLGTGLFDVVTFLIPPYDKPILKPEYAIDSAVDKMSSSADW